MLIYCDTNVYCRPLDDQSQRRIKTETDAFLEILERVERKEIILISSDILVAEVKRITDGSKRQLVELYVARCSRHIPASLEIARTSHELVKWCQLKPKDAFHVASACQGHVGFFLTCDDRVTNKHNQLVEETKRMGFTVEALNPIEFLSLPK